MTGPSVRTQTVGSVEVTPHWDGPLLSNLGKVPDPDQRREAQALLADAPGSAFTMNVYSFLLNVGSALALIDAGGGTTPGSHLGQMRLRLQELGIAPEAIRHIFMTHMHRDHYGGLLSASGEAYYPNAELILHHIEAAVILDTSPGDMHPRAFTNLEQQRQVLSVYRGRIRRVTENESVLGVSARLAAGHTPGHTCWLLASDGAQLLLWGDTVHVARVQVAAPHITFEYDLDPLLAAKSRRRVLDWVSRDRIPVAGAHLPGSGLAMIDRERNGYSFRSI